MFLNTLTGDAKDSVQDCENSRLPIQMELSEKQKLFRYFFFPFLESTSNFKCFEKKTIVIANVSPKLENMKNLFTILSKKRRFRPCFDSQHVKASQILWKSP